MKKKIMIAIMVIIVGVIPLAGCNTNTIETELGESMPIVWEEECSYVPVEPPTVIKTSIARPNMLGKKEVYLDADYSHRLIDNWINDDGLYSITVDENNKTLTSEDGVVYSKSYETLVKWPAKKPVENIRSSVKYFAPRCFLYCTLPEDFELPEQTVSIGRRAFYGSNLTKIHLKENIKTAYVPAVKTIEISAEIAYVNYFGTQAAETIIFHEGVRQIRSDRDTRGLFKDLKQVEFPSTLEAIGNVYFPVNVKVMQYTLGENVQYLSENAFDDYSEVINITEYREGKTSFTYSTECCKEYFEKKIPGWDKNWDFVMSSD